MSDNDFVAVRRELCALYETNAEFMETHGRGIKPKRYQSPKNTKKKKARDQS